MEFFKYGRVFWSPTSFLVICTCSSQLSFAIVDDFHFPLACEFNISLSSSRPDFQLQKNVWASVASLMLRSARRFTLQSQRYASICPAFAYSRIHHLEHSAAGMVIEDS